MLRKRARKNYGAAAPEKLKMSLVERTIRILFVLNGFGILLYLGTMLKVQVETKSWLSCGLLVAAWASLLWFLHRESQLPASPASIVGHAVWVLSALGYIWLGDDPLITFVPVTEYDSSGPVPPMLAEAERTRLILSSIYYLLSTTGMAWLLRLVTGKRTDSSQAQSSVRMNGRLLVSICAMLTFFAISSIEDLYSKAGFAALGYAALTALILLVWLLVAIEVARGNKMAFRVGTAGLLCYMLISFM